MSAHNGVLYPRRCNSFRDPNQFAAGFDHADGLLYRAQRIQGVHGGHGLQPDRVGTAYAQVAHLYLAGKKTGIAGKAVAIEISRKRHRSYKGKNSVSLW
jgi:hypothetical protein